MKKIKLLTAFALSAALLVGCGGKEATENNGGTTETPAVSETAKFTGTKTYETLYDATGAKGDVVKVDVEFKDGEPVKASVDVIQEDGSSKKEAAAEGKYVMKADAKYHWGEQIELIEEELNKNGVDTSKINITDADGHTDAVSGVSIKIKTYLDAIDEVITAVEAGKELPTGFTGIKVDERKYDPEKEDMLVTKVVYNHGEPVNVHIDLTLAEAVDLGDGKTSTSKKAVAAAGKYVMVEGSDNTWDKQIEALEEFIVSNKFDLTKVTLTDDDGHTDAVSGVSVKIGTYLKAVEETLKK